MKLGGYFEGVKLGGYTTLWFIIFDFMKYSHHLFHKFLGHFRNNLPENFYIQGSASKNCTVLSF